MPRPTWRSLGQLGAASAVVGVRDAHDRIEEQLGEAGFPRRNRYLAARSGCLTPSSGRSLTMHQSHPLVALRPQYARIRARRCLLPSGRFSRPSGASRYGPIIVQKTSGCDLRTTCAVDDGPGCVPTHSGGRGSRTPLPLDPDWLGGWW